MLLGFDHELAARYADKPDRYLGALLDTWHDVLRAKNVTISQRREGAQKRRVVMAELYGRAQEESYQRRLDLITKLLVFSTAELKILEHELLKAIGHRNCHQGTRRIHREKLILVRAELRERELGRDQLPERDDRPEED